MSVININFANAAQREFYFTTARNQTFSGGFNNGKTFIGCLKASTLLTTFSSYKYAICRQTYSDLKKTTMQTFFKQLPDGQIDSHNEQDGFTRFKNKSIVHWLHLDNVDESTLRGLEVNGILVDQAEETEEKVYNVLEARLGRWDGVQIPPSLLNAFNGDWPISAQGKLVAPSYISLLTNPETFFHYIYRYYHPDSMERRPNHFYVEGAWDPTLGSEESYASAINKDEEWVAKYVKGEWGASQAQIHILPKESLLDYSPELISWIKEKGNLFRVMDHGDTSPTCCLWVAAIGGVYIFFREYYVANKVISYHRQGIDALSKGEEYSNNYADPSIFKIKREKDGNNFWTIADEYKTSDLEGPPLFWVAADNNEFATRNRINELLIPSPRFMHPVTKDRPAVGIYFVKGCKDYPYGCKESIRQIGMQRKVLLGTLDGKSIYSDDRDENVPDHAYDPVRYFVAMHGTSPIQHQKKAPRNSFAYYNAVLERAKSLRFSAGG